MAQFKEEFPDDGYEYLHKTNKVTIQPPEDYFKERKRKIKEESGEQTDKILDAYNLYVKTGVKDLRIPILVEVSKLRKIDVLRAIIIQEWIDKTIGEI